MHIYAWNLKTFKLSVLPCNTLPRPASPAGPFPDYSTYPCLLLVPELSVGCFELC